MKLVVIICLQLNIALASKLQNGIGNYESTDFPWWELSPHLSASNDINASPMSQKDQQARLHGDKESENFKNFRFNDILSKYMQSRDVIPAGWAKSHHAEDVQDEGKKMRQGTVTRILVPSTNNADKILANFFYHYRDRDEAAKDTTMDTTNIALETHGSSSGRDDVSTMGIQQDRPGSGSRKMKWTKSPFMMGNRGYLVMKLNSWGGTQNVHPYNYRKGRRNAKTDDGQNAGGEQVQDDDRSFVDTRWA